MNGINSVNNVSNIINALDTDRKWAKAFYNVFLNHVVKVKVFACPYIGNADELRTYLFDIMNELFVMVPNHDPELDTVFLKAGILQDNDPNLKKEDPPKHQVALIHDELQYMASLIERHILREEGLHFQGYQFQVRCH